MPSPPHTVQFFWRTIIPGVTPSSRERGTDGETWISISPVPSHSRQGSAFWNALVPVLEWSDFETGHASGWTVISDRPHSERWCGQSLFWQSREHCKDDFRDKTIFWNWLMDLYIISWTFWDASRAAFHNWIRNTTEVATNWHREFN